MKRHLLVGLFASSLIEVVAQPLPQQRADSAQSKTANNEPHESFWQRTADDPVAIFTAVLALFTGVLFVYTAKLWGATKTLARDAKEGSDKTVAQMQRTADAARDSAELSRKAFIATFRPKLVVRGIRIESSGNNATIRYSITNQGGSQARIIRHQAGVGLLGYEAVLPIDEWPKLNDEWTIEGALAEGLPALAAGATAPFSREVDAAILAYLEQPSTYRPTTAFLLGHILYEDDAGVQRYVGFARHYISGRKRFEALSDPDYEYAD